MTGTAISRDGHSGATATPQRPPHPLLRTAALGVALALAIFVAVPSVQAIGSRMADIFEGDKVRGDLLSFYAAGHLIGTGRGGDLYDLEAQQAAQEEIFPWITDDVIAYALPVFAAVAMWPLTLISFHAAYILWTGLNALLLLAIALLLWRMIPSVPPSLRLLLLACLSLSMPVLYVFAWGQVDLIVLLALLLAYRNLQTDRPATAGALAALALIKPFLALGAALFLLAQGRRRALVAFSATAAALLLLPLPLTGAEGLLGNLGMAGAFSETIDELGASANTMTNWRGFVISVTGRNDFLLWAPAAAITGLGALALAVRAWRRSDARGPHALAYGWSLACFLPALLSPHLHFQNLVVLALPAALVLEQSFANGEADGRRQTLAAIALLTGFALINVLRSLTVTGLSLTMFALVPAYVALALRWPQQREAPAARVIPDRLAA